MKNIRTHYDNLKVARNAPSEVIRAAYKTLSQKHHPDRNGNSVESQRVMKIINESYAALSDPDARRRHDAWILEQELPETYQDESQRPQRQIETPPPLSGEINFYDLDEETKKRIKNRASGVNKNQIRIKLDGVLWNYIWCAILSGWFYYIYTSAAEHRWEEKTIYWHAGLTAIFGLLLARNISWLYSWHSKPLKSSLVVTPLYLIKFYLDQISYWPIWTISDIGATHNYRNGFYQDTALFLTLDGHRKAFSISPKSAYQKLVDKLQEYDTKFKSAMTSNDVTYIVDNDEFLLNRENRTNRKKNKSLSTVAIYMLTLLLSFGFLWISHNINNERPFKPEYSKSKTPYNSTPLGKPNYVRPATAPNGVSWPSIASYIASYPKLNTGGLSSVTVDNKQNDSDVFVKLVSIAATESHPVRVFFIPASGKFKISGIKPGLYDIRYRDLTTGGLARSDSFTLEEVSTDSGTRYSDMTMTLYKVRNGNMQTYGLSESEF